MTQEQITADDQVIAKYDRLDEAFRTAKKVGQHKTAGEYKTQRDALESQANAAIRRRVARKQGQ